MSENWAFGGSPSPLDKGGVTTILQGSSFSISEANGDLHPGAAEGLFVRDTRFLSRWELRVDGNGVEGLAVTRPQAFTATFVCRGAPPEGQADSALLVLRRRTVGDGLREVLELHNLGGETIARSVTLLVDADFADIFEVKENRVPHRSDATTTLPDADGLRVHYRWMGRHLGVAVTADPRPASSSGGALSFDVVLPPREAWRVQLEVHPLLDGEDGSDPPDLDNTAAVERLDRWRRQRTVVTSRDPGLSATIHTSEADLGALHIVDPRAPRPPRGGGRGALVHDPLRPRLVDHRRTCRCRSTPARPGTLRMLARNRALRSTRAARSSRAASCTRCGRAGGHGCAWGTPASTTAPPTRPRCSSCCSESCGAGGSPDAVDD